ncbi:MAG TPA: VIT1/CCC1 transporter family protein [Candidatus Eisenbacteria bacterium]|nr:VIT1/CCC1 transporter family protein [Candidatus Eisenbacteria bacterium]
MKAHGTEAGEAGGNVLDPVERLSEILFGLIMALTFTGSIHAASLEDEIRATLAGAIGCNIAWGIVDAVMYVMTLHATRSRALRALRQVREAASREEAAALLSDLLPDAAAKAMTPHDFESLRGWLRSLPEQRVRTLTLRDFRGALGVFLLVTVSTFPVVVPFLFVDDAVSALRLSNAIALAMLFGIGWALGKHAGMRPLLTGASMLAVGVVLVALTIALGG